jgi:hypothetical protein
MSCCVKQEVCFGNKFDYNANIISNAIVESINPVNLWKKIAKPQTNCKRIKH